MLLFSPTQFSRTQPMELGPISAQSVQLRSPIPSEPDCMLRCHVHLAPEHCNPFPPHRLGGGEGHGSETGGESGAAARQGPARGKSWRRYGNRLTPSASRPSRAEFRTITTGSRPTASISRAVESIQMIREGLGDGIDIGVGLSREDPARPWRRSSARRSSRST